ncbi:MAG: AsmA family protein [Proteobacteria bacterium]|nr:AsmA family protein [Pseudomonadota bacterium]
MRWKWIPIIFVSILIVAIVAVYITLSSYDFNKLKPQVEQAAYEATGRALKLDGDIELKIGFTPVLVVREVTLENAKWGSRPAAVSVKRFEVQVAILPLLGRRIEIQRIVIVEPDILVETDRKGRSNLQFTPPKKTEAEAVAAKEPSSDTGLELPELVVGEVLIESGRLTYRDGLSTKSTSVILDRLKAEGAGLESALKFDLKGSLDSRSFGATGSFDSLAKLTDPTLGPVKLSGLKLLFDGNRITGSVVADTTAARPALTAELTTESLDLRKFFSDAQAPAAKKETEVKESVRKEKVFSSEPIEAGFLKSVDLDLRFKAAKLLLPLLAIDDLSVKMSLKAGRLKLSPVKAKVGGGTLEARVEVRPRGKALAVDAEVKLKGIELDSLGRELKVTEVLNGTIDADIKLKAKGESVAALMASLDGQKRVVMGKGRIDNKFLKFVGGDLNTGLLRLLNPLAAKESYTVVNCMVVGFNVEDGLASSSAMLFDTSHMTIVGNGKINFAKETLDVSLKPMPKEGLGTSGLGKLTLSLGELARPFKPGGTFVNPGLAVDPAQTMLTIGKVMGGNVLFGPAGLAAALVGTSSGDENPCLTAIEASKKKSAAPKAVKKPVEQEQAEEGSVVPKSLPIPDDIKDVGEGLLKLFSQ